MKIDEIFGMAEKPLKAAASSEDVQQRASQATKAALFRGMNKLSDPITLIRIRSDRKPLHSSPLMVTVFNNIMSNMGVPFRKQNTVSLTTKPTQARTYGQPYRIYPLDGTRYLYGNIFDMWDISSGAMAFMYRQGIEQGWVPKVGPWGVPSEYDQEAILNQHPAKVTAWCRENAKMMWEKYQLVSTVDPVEAATQAKGEILIYGKAYFAVALT